MPTSLPTRFPTARLAALFAAFSLCLSVGAARADDLTDIQKLMKAGQYPQALEKTDAHIAGKPRDPQGRFMKGLILTEMNRPVDAIAVFTKLTEDYPELPEPYNNLAVLYAQQKQYEKARTALEMAIRTHPAYAIAYENLGDVYAKLASQAYDRALQLDSSNSVAQSKLSLIRDLVSTNTRPGSKPAAPAAAAPKPVVAEAPKPAEPVVAKPAATVVPVAPATVAAAKPTDTPKVAERPAAKAEEAPAPAAKAAAGEAEAAEAVRAWAAAWSKKDVKAYLAHYAPDFQTPKGMSRKDWEAERQRRIDKPGVIDVDVDDLKVAIDGNTATARFRQGYKSARFSTATGKTLVLVRNGGKWLIQQERVN